MHIPTGEIVELTSEQKKEFQRLFSPKKPHRRLSSEKDKLVSLTDKEAGILTPMDIGNRKNWMRNKPCVCGSGKKFKKCCWNEYEQN